MKNFDDYTPPDVFSFTHWHTTQKYTLEKVEDGQWMCGKAKYYLQDIRYHLNNGHWNLVEPELVFPFSFAHCSGSNFIYTAVGIEDDGSIRVTWDGDSVSGWNVEGVKRLIQEGTWIVKSVGEQKAPEAPASDVVSIKIEVDSSELKEALQAANELTEAINQVTLAAARMKQAFKY